MIVLFVLVLVVVALIARRRARRHRRENTTDALGMLLHMRPTDAPRFARYPAGRRVARRRYR